MQGDGILASNLKAIQMLTEGSHGDAVIAFRTTLGHLLSKISDESSPTVPEDASLAENIFKPVSCSVPGSWNSDLEESIVSYDKAFLISGCDGGDAIFCTNKQCNQACVSVLFNMGLSFHLMASHSTTNQHKHLNKAIKFYQMALDANHKNEASQVKNIFSMAILNNMGSIFSHFLQVDRMQQCLQGMLELFRQLPSEPGLVCEDDVTLFRMNVALLHGKHLDVAPAA